jgi:hypothetical protein
MDLRDHPDDHLRSAGPCSVSGFLNAERMAGALGAGGDQHAHEYDRSMDEQMRAEGINNGLGSTRRERNAAHVDQARVRDGMDSFLFSKHDPNHYPYKFHDTKENHR